MFSAFPQLHSSSNILVQFFLFSYYCYSLLSPWASSPSTLLVVLLSYHVPVGWAAGCRVQYGVSRSSHPRHLPPTRSLSPLRHKNSRPPMWVMRRAKRRPLAKWDDVVGCDVCMCTHACVCVCIEDKISHACLPCLDLCLSEHLFPN